MDLNSAICIISLEIYLDGLNFHIIIQKPLGKVYTLTTKTIKNKNLQTKLFDYILNNQFDDLISYFKKECDIIHCPISISYGPQIRKILKQRTGFTEKQL